jgi:hypothetical protein
MKATGHIKTRENNNFYVKKIRGGYWAVIDRYTMGMESLETSEEAAKELANKLNELR